ncbi:Hypothetical protein FKW44_017249 [Caligus rogercresseyi]|uniref:Uncharacterized protein n=1 Tax=Caligus rogercresseyi TaxID=217165 RepID=A0A7T8H399_CALRO|nr:Hypothetical protein FKW44_017249 [Caligus rogercresseyi]
MSSELEVQDGHYCGAPLRPCAQEIIDFFKSSKLLFTAFAKSFKESDDIEKRIPNTGKKDSTSNLVAKLVLRESRHVLVKGVLAHSSPDLNPCDYYWGCAHNTVDSMKAAIIQAVANLSREQVVHAVGGSGTVWRCYCERRKLD